MTVLYCTPLVKLGLIKEYDPEEAIHDEALEGMDATTLRKLYEEVKSKEQCRKPRAKAKIKATTVEPSIN